MGTAKFNSEQVKAFYLSVHKTALSKDPHEETAPVINPTGSKLLNRFTDYAHRLGMRRGFQYLTRRRGSLNGAKVLDLGCGRGRWTKEYTLRGARVTGADISREALQWLSGRFPGNNFACADIARLPFASDSFDVINSVTVLQHMQDDLQRAALQECFRLLRPGGHLVLLENVADFEYLLVHPHRRPEWIRMAEDAGLRLRLALGSNYEILVRTAVRIRNWRGQRGTAHPIDNGPATARPNSLPVNAIALASFPVEYLCHKLPLFEPSHALMIFERV